MAITISVGNTYSGRPGTISLPVPSSQAGDISFVAIACVSQTLDPYPSVTSPPAGWTVVPPGMLHPTNNLTMLAVWYYRVWKAGDPTTVSIAVSRSWAVGLTFRARGADTSTALVSAAKGYNSMLKTSPVDAPSLLATTAPNVMVCFFAAYSSSSSDASPTWSTAAGMTELAEVPLTGQGSVGGPGIAVDYQPLDVAGATGTRTAYAAAPQGSGHYPLAASLLLYGSAPPPRPPSVLRIPSQDVTVQFKTS